MELVLPQNYVEIEQEEMMYLDGGDAQNFANNINGALTRMGISYANRMMAGIPSNAALAAMTWKQAAIFFPTLTAKISALTGNPIVIGIAVAVSAAGLWAIWNKRLFY